jgi:Tol biopolymer transport system component
MRDKLYLRRPRFSPDGKWIAYAREAFMNGENLYVMAGAGQPRRITQGPWLMKGFTWSIDGKSLLAFSSRQSNKLQMWKFPLNGSEPYPVGELDAGRGSDPTLSRRKGSLAWVRDLSANSLWRMPADQSGQPPERLVNSAAADTDAEWSRNGRMVFRSDRSELTNCGSQKPTDLVPGRRLASADRSWVILTGHLTAAPSPSRPRRTATLIFM